MIDQKNRKFYIADEDIGPAATGHMRPLSSSTWIAGLVRCVSTVTNPPCRKIFRSRWTGAISTVPGKDGKPTMIKVGCDGITMDVRAEWVYFAPLTGRSVYRIRVADLNDEKLPAELSARLSVTRTSRTTEGSRSTMPATSI